MKGQTGRRLAVLAVLCFAVAFVAIATKPLAASALSPWLQSIEANYVDLGRTKVVSDGVQLGLKDPAGLLYGETWDGARNLAIYAVVRYQLATGRTFPRPTAYAWNAVDAEIYDHCRWALGKGLLGTLSLVRSRANPINIGVNDKPPLWGGLRS